MIGRDQTDLFTFVPFITTAASFIYQTDRMTTSMEEVFGGNGEATGSHPSLQPAALCRIEVIFLFFSVDLTS